VAMMLYYTKVFTPTEVIERGAVVISDEGRIAYIGPMEDVPRVDGLRMDLRGRIVVATALPLGCLAGSRRISAPIPSGYPAPA
jgi:hypothetical protein